jgi:uncharacterized membrane protein
VLPRGNRLESQDAPVPVGSSGAVAHEHLDMIDFGSGQKAEWSVRLVHCGSQSRIVSPVSPWCKPAGASHVAIRPDGWQAREMTVVRSDHAGKTMTKGRVEAFSDGVIAIIITIMVLELRPPDGTDWASVRPAIFSLLTYVLSFVFLGIYWNNHHHMFQAADHINGRILWANLHLLFWLSLVPFVTEWMGANHFSSLPTAVYGALLLLAALAWTILQREIIALHGPDSHLAAAVGRNFKATLSTTLYIVAIPLAFVNRWISDAIYVFVALLWLAPDPRIEATLIERAGQAPSKSTHGDNH